MTKNKFLQTKLKYDVLIGWEFSEQEFREQLKKLKVEDNTINFDSASLNDLAEFAKNYVKSLGEYITKREGEFIVVTDKNNITSDKKIEKDIIVAVHLPKNSRKPYDFINVTGYLSELGPFFSRDVFNLTVYWFKK